MLGRLDGSINSPSSRQQTFLECFRLKYSLFYGRDGLRIVGYDNERGKGDHKHLGEMETRYRFVSVEKLVADFLADVERATNERNA
jgi:hypothetical protein